MAGLTAEGFEAKPFTEILEEVETTQKDEISADLDFSEDSAFNTGINTPFCSLLAESWEELLVLYSALDPNVAEDTMLDHVAALTGTVRDSWTKTTVEASVTLNPNASLPAGSVANLSGQPAVRFVSLAEVPADPSGGTFTVTFEAEDAGAITVAVGELTEISEPQTGWTVVTNAEAGITGTQPETDAELRQKRIDGLTAAGSTSVSAIQASLSNLEGVLGCFVEENTSDFYSDGIPPHSVRATIRGGIDEEIASALNASRPAGNKSTGPVSYQLTLTNGTQVTERWRESTAKYLNLEAVVVWNDATKLTEVKTQIEEYVESVNIGETVFYDQVKCAMYENDYIKDITSLTIWFQGDSPGTVNLELEGDEHVEIDSFNDLDIT